MVDQKQIKAHIYPDIYKHLAKLDDFKEHGLTYAINAELARRFGLPLPETPKSKMSAAGRKRTGAEKNAHKISLPPDWFMLFEMLINGETWHRKDYPVLSALAESAGLVRFVKKHGAKATQNLIDIWNHKDHRRQLQKIIQSVAEAKGYELVFER